MASTTFESSVTFEEWSGRQLELFQERETDPKRLRVKAAEKLLKAAKADFYKSVNGGGGGVRPNRSFVAEAEAVLKEARARELAEKLQESGKADLVALVPRREPEPEPALPPPVEVFSCPVCCDDLPKTEAVVLCGEGCKTEVCAPCTSRFLRGDEGGERSYVVERGANCAQPTCPFCHMRLSYKKWSAWAVVHNHGELRELVKKYDEAVFGNISINCPSCHRVTTPLLPPENWTTSNLVIRAIQTLLAGRSDMKACMEQILPEIVEEDLGLAPSFVSPFSAGGARNVSGWISGGRISAAPVPALGAHSWVWKRGSALFQVASMLGDPALAAWLILRAFKVEPRFEAPCCGRVMCFGCTSSNIHLGRPCPELFVPENSLLQCPNCEAVFQKTEGCDSITCTICRHNWYAPNSTTPQQQHHHDHTDDEEEEERDGYYDEYNDYYNPEEVD